MSLRYIFSLTHDRGPRSKLDSLSHSTEGQGQSRRIIDDLVVKWNEKSRKFSTKLLDYKNSVNFEGP